jgi:hypothetical protein
MERRAYSEYDYFWDLFVTANRSTRFLIEEEYKIELPDLTFLISSSGILMSAFYHYRKNDYNINFPIYHSFEVATDSFLYLLESAMEWGLTKSYQATILVLNENYWQKISFDKRFQVVRILDDLEILKCLTSRYPYELHAALVPTRSRMLIPDSFLSFLRNI